MSWGPTCALMLPSAKRIRPCTRDCGCTTTSIASSGRSNRKCASRTSSPLLNRVAESIVTLRPIDQVGWRSACSGVTCERSAGPSRKGPPDAVSTSARTALRGSPTSTWNSAECSESTGVMRAPLARASSHISGPATTIASLLASATWRPARRAAAVGSSPSKPGMAATTASASSVAASTRPSAPVARRVPPGRCGATCSATAASHTTSSGRNSAAWATSASALRRATRATGRYPCQRATSRVCMPIDPVEPSTTMRFAAAASRGCMCPFSHASRQARRSCTWGCYPWNGPQGGRHACS